MLTVFVDYCEFDSVDQARLYDVDRYTVKR